MPRTNKLPIHTILLLAIIPIITAFIVFGYENNMGPTYQFGIDPEYTYLFNSLNMATGEFNVGHIHHPGTPVQVIGGITIKLFHLFDSNETIIQDVLSNPEKYIRLISISTLLCIIAVLIATSLWVFRITQEVLPVLTVQLVSLCTFFDCYHNFGRITPEPLLTVPAILLTGFLLLYYYKPHKYKYEWLFAASIGLGAATKIMFLSFIFLPLFFFRGKKRLYFVLLTIGFFFLFAFPILIKLQDYYQWIINLSMHSGIYGSGEANVINTSMIGPRFVWLTEILPLYPLAIILCIYALIKKNKQNNEPTLKKFILGILLSFLLYLVMAIKHWAIHYMFAGAMMLPITYFILLEFFAKRSLFLSKYKTIISYSAMVIALAFMLNSHIKNINYHKTRLPHSLSSIKKIHELVGDKKLLFFQGFLNSAYVEAGMHHGYCVSGRKKIVYRDYMMKLYPNFVIMPASGERFFDWDHWNHRYSVNDVINPIDSGFIYTSVKNDYRFEKLQEYLDKDYNDSVRLSYKPVLADSIGRHYLYTFKTSYDSIYFDGDQVD